MTSNTLLRPLWFSLVATLLAVSSSLASAQDLYKVEVIVFERKEAPTGDAERWPRDIELAYPADTQALTERQPSAEAELGFEAEGAYPAPYQLLPPESLSLTGRKNALGRDYRLRPIYHQAWLQPLTGPRQSLPVQIVGGDSFGEQRELGGTIEVSVNKFIHLDAHLWLATFERNEGQLPEPWPPLPSIGGTERVNDFAFNPTESVEFPTEDPATQRGGESTSWESQGLAGATPNQAEFADQNLGVTTPSAEPFLVKEIVTMNQSRRMRTAEVHYLDHPKLGVLVQVEKYQPGGQRP